MTRTEPQKQTEQYTEQKRTETVTQQNRTKTDPPSIFPTMTDEVNILVTLCQTLKTHFGTYYRIPLGEDQPHLEILPEVIRNYGLAVQYGHRHIFQSLPRLLTLWFDFGSHIKSITVTQKACSLLLNAQALLYVLHLHCITCFNQLCLCSVSLVSCLGIYLQNVCATKTRVLSPALEEPVYTCANASATYLHLFAKVNCAWFTAIFIHPSMHPCIHASILLPIHSPIHLPIHSPIHSPHTSIHPPTHPPTHHLGSRTTSPDQPSLPHKVICWESAHQAQCLLMWVLQNRQISTAVANIMAAMAKALPSYAWLTALPQLISRICHTNPEVNTVTNHIITHVAEAYPQQVLLPGTLMLHEGCW